MCVYLVGCYGMTWTARIVPFQARCIIEYGGQDFDDFPPPVTSHLPPLQPLRPLTRHAPVSQKDTNWEGGEYRITMAFTEDYPTKVGTRVCMVLGTATEKTRKH